MSATKKKPEEIQRRGKDLTHLPKWRRLNGLTQDALANLSGVTRVQIGFIERGISFAMPKTLDKLATALNIPVNVLLSSPEDLSLDDMKRYNPAMYHRVVSFLQRQTIAERQDHLSQSA